VTIWSGFRRCRPYEIRLRNVVPSNDLSHCHGWLIWQYFYRHDAEPAAQRRNFVIVIMSMVSSESLAAQAPKF
jgi:hypothetical protein